MILIWTLIASLTTALAGADTGDTAPDYDEETRGPYEFQFRVDDPETYNKYEVRTMLVRLIKIAGYHDTHPCLDPRIR